MQNVLFILTDQWPAWAFGFLGADIPTPNIDRLSSQGTVFTNAFTSCPLCTPARGTLLTARWPHQNGVYDNQSVGYSLQESMPLDQKTWIDEAVRLGYYVGYYGKWHLGHINPEKRGAHGFDPNIETHAKPYHPQTMITPTKRPLPATPTKPKTSSKDARHFGETHRNQKKISNPFPP